MCGRISQTASYGELTEWFDLARGFELDPRYNIAPSRDVAVVRLEEDGRSLVLLHWGLIPFWADDSRIGYRTINARAETAHKSPAYRAAFRARRCLIPADGFYEWDKKGGSRQPYYIRRADGKAMALAGLWEHWESKEGNEVIESCTILTTEASEPVATLHDRMPVILETEDFAAWLDPDEHRVERLRELLQPAAPGVLEMYSVSSYVNKAGNEGERCIEPIEGSG